MENQETNMSPSSHSGILVIVNVCMTVILFIAVVVLGVKVFSAATAPSQVIIAATPIDTGSMSSAATGESRVFSGTVISLSGSKMVVGDPSSKDPSVNKTVLVSNDTKFVELQVRDPKVVAAEMKDYQAKLAAAKTSLVLPPDPVTRVDSTASVVAIGDDVVVTSIGSANSQVLAASEVIFSKPVVAPTASTKAPVKK